MLFVISLIAAIIEIAVALNNHPGPGFGGHLVRVPSRSNKPFFNGTLEQLHHVLMELLCVVFSSSDMQVLGTIVVCIGIFCFPATIKLVLFFASPEQRAKVKFRPHNVQLKMFKSPPFQSLSCTDISPSPTWFSINDRKSPFAVLPMYHV